MAADYDPSGQSLAVADAEGRVQIWWTDSWHMTRTLPIAGSELTDLVLLTPETLITGQADGMAIVWDIPLGEMRTRLSGHSGAITSIAVYPDRRTVATAGLDRTIRLWDPVVGALRLSLSVGAQPNHLQFSPDGTQLATACEDGTVRCWSIDDDRSSLRRAERADETG